MQCQPDRAWACLGWCSCWVALGSEPVLDPQLSPIPSVKHDVVATAFSQDLRFLWHILLPPEGPQRSVWVVVRVGLQRVCEG